MTDQINERAAVTPDETAPTEEPTEGATSGIEESPAVDLNVNEGDPIKPEPEDEV